METTTISDYGAGVYVCTTLSVPYDITYTIAEDITTLTT